MNRILIVDDDPFVLQIYQRGLGRQGLVVETANDGLSAIKAMRANKPDLVVLDLMMPTFNGLDVLKFIRAQPDLAGLPVVVMSNAYMGELAQDVVAQGVQKALLKVSCSPAVLLGVIKDLLEGKELKVDPSRLMPVPEIEQSVLARPAPVVARAASTHDRPTTPLPPPGATPPNERELRARARQEFLGNGPATCAALREMAEALDKEPTQAGRRVRLQDFYRKVHFLAAAAGLAECEDLAEMGTVFEAMLYALAAKLEFFTPSVRQTNARVVKFLALLFEQARHRQAGGLKGAKELVVDDEPVSGRLAVSALSSARLQVHNLQDPALALEALRQSHYDLLLVDIEMPGMDGFEFCKRARALPGYEKTPLIYVSLHSDFESRAKGIMSGGNDLIAKPVFPMELATKAVMHLLRAKLPA